MKKLSAVLGGYSPQSPDEAKFADKHKIKKTDDAHGNDDKLFKASNIKPVDRESPENHGYNPGTDEKVYESSCAVAPGNSKKKRILPTPNAAYVKGVTKEMKEFSPNMLNTIKKINESKKPISENQELPLSTIKPDGTGSALNDPNLIPVGHYMLVSKATGRIWGSNHMKPTWKDVVDPLKHSDPNAEPHSHIYQKTGPNTIQKIEPGK